MTGLGIAADIYIVFWVLFVGSFMLLNRYLNNKEEQFRREHNGEEMY